MTIVLKILGWLLLGCVTLIFTTTAVAFGMGVMESIRGRRKRQERRVEEQQKRSEGGVKIRVVWPE